MSAAPRSRSLATDRKVSAITEGSPPQAWARISWSVSMVFVRRLSRVRVVWKWWWYGDRMAKTTPYGRFDFMKNMTKSNEIQEKGPGPTVPVHAMLCGARIQLESEGDCIRNKWSWWFWWEQASVDLARCRWRFLGDPGYGMSATPRTCVWKMVVTKFDTIRWMVVSF